MSYQCYYFQCTLCMRSSWAQALHNGLHHGPLPVYYAGVENEGPSPVRCHASGMTC